jgi:hypothetical protein
MNMRACLALAMPEHAALRTWDWQLGRVYFLAFLNPIKGTTGPSPYRQVGQSLPP